MTTSTWTGAGNATSWSDPSNWSPVGIPPSYLPVDIAQTGIAPVSVVIAAGQSEGGNPLTLGAAGTSEAVTLTNNGSFGNYAGATLYTGTTLANTGSMTLSAEDIFGTQSNTGSEQVYGALTVESGGLLDNLAGSMTLNGEDILGSQTNAGAEQVNGKVTIASGGTLDVLAGGSMSVASTLTINGLLRVEGILTSATGLTGTGQVLVDGGSLSSVSGSIDLAGSALDISITDGGTLNAYNITASDTFSFGATQAGGTNTLIIPSYSGTVSANITNFGVGDSINTGVDSTPTITTDGSVYTVTIGSVTIENVSLSGGLTTGNIKVSSGILTVACYVGGTRVATPSGEVAVEMLRIGDLVRTHAGQDRPVKWIGRRFYPAGTAAQRREVRPIRISRDALADGLPRRDLLVSPEHALLLGGVLVPARHLVNGVSTAPVDGRGGVRYFHIELEDHDIILAEGQPAETFVDCESRKMFDNAAGFAALYPDDASPAWTFCAERVENGEALADIRHGVNLRAGLADGDWRQDHAPGPLKGNLEVVSDDDIAGWAQDSSAPERPVLLEILDNGEVIARVLANAYRGDLEQAGLGSGRHAFSVRPVLRRSDKPGHVIKVRRASDQAALPGSPAVVAETGFPAGRDEIAFAPHPTFAIVAQRFRRTAPAMRSRI
jgi:hypothetical protein